MELYLYRATVLRVVDGDTIDCQIDLGFGVTLAKERFRLFGINAPETRLGKNTNAEEKAAGLATKEWLKEEIEGKEVVLKTIKGGKGKYGRWLAIVLHNGIDLNQYMLDAEMVEEYLP